MTAEPFPDFSRAPNIADNQATYERENEAIDPSGVLWRTLREQADWSGRTVLDLGCGTGFWLPRYATGSGAVTAVVGVEPDPVLRAEAAGRLDGVEVLAGSAGHCRCPMAASMSSTRGSPTSSRRAANRACARRCGSCGRAGLWS